MATNHTLRRSLSALALLWLLAGLFSLVWARAAAQGPDEAQLEEGVRLYAENCAVCHGPDGQGRVGATLAKDWPSIRPDLQIESTIRSGIDGTAMPAWGPEHGGPLNDQQIEALVAYILSWESGEPRIYEPVDNPTPRPAISPPAGVEGDPNHGALLYDENCAVCHGPDGQGRIGATLTKEWPSIRPDLQVKNTISSGIEGSPMPAWSQEHGGPLNETEINDLVAFVVSLPGHQGETGQQPALTPTPAQANVPLLDGVGGVVLLGVLFIVLVGGILLAQRRSP